MTETTPKNRWWIAVVFGSMIFAAVSVVTAHYRYGSIDNAVNAIGGQVLLVSEFSAPSCTASANASNTVRVTVRNLLNQPVTIVGAKTSCGCLEAIRVPLTVAAVSSDELEFRYIAGDEEWSGAVDVQLFVDVESPPIVFTVDVQTIIDKDVE